MSPFKSCLRCSLALYITPNHDSTEDLADAPFGCDALVAELRRIAAILDERLPERSPQGQRFVDPDEREQLVVDFLQKHPEATAPYVQHALRSAGYATQSPPIESQPVHKEAPESRRTQVERMLRTSPELSSAEIAETCGVTKRYVNRIRMAVGGNNMGTDREHGGNLGWEQGGN